MRRTITMNQSRYIEEVLKRFHIEDCKPVATPSDISTKLVKDMHPKSDVEAKSMAKVPYQEAVGLWIVCSSLEYGTLEYIGHLLIVSDSTSLC